MPSKHIYWRFLGVHVITGWAAALLFSLGVTYILAASNPFLLVMSIMVPIFDIYFSKRYVRRLIEDRDEQEKENETGEEDQSYIRANRVLIVSLTGFGIGILIHLMTVMAVFI